MAAVIKVKPKKNYEWNQDKKYVYVQVPLPSHSSLKKVDLYLSDLILRVTSLQKNQTQTLDLAQEIDCHSPENKFILSNGLLHATLKKATPDSQWPQLLVEGISLEELRDRRKESSRRQEEHTKTVEQNKSKIRIDYEQKATRELMRFEGEERQKLEHKKRVEKEQAINSVFSNVNQKTGAFQKENKEAKKQELQRSENVWKEKEQLALTMLEKEQAEEIARRQQERVQKNKSKIIEQVTKKYQTQASPVKTQESMFTAEDIQKYDEMRQNAQEGIQYQEIPIRKAATQKVNFTERIHRNLAARDTFYKEPPMPKNQSNRITNGDVQQKNPLWLKDKGDGFLKDKNYISAIEAYSEALKIDCKLFGAVLNRSVCYMRIFRLQEAINDSEQGLILLQSQISGDQKEQVHSRLTLAKLKTRKAICCAWKGELDVAKKQLSQVLELDLTDDIKKQVGGCLEQIKNRQISIQSKSKGDEQVRVNNHEAAVQHYNQAIQIDQNQYAISNKVLCLNKLKKFKQAAQEAQKCIKRLSLFNISPSFVQNKEDKQASLILLKLYYRKAKALEEMNNLAEAQENVRKGLTINSQDKDLQDYLKALRRMQNKQVIAKLKEEAATFIKASKIKEALENYSKCLKMLEQAEDIQEYLAVLQNQCVCYQKIEKFDDVLSICIRILKLVNRLEQKILEFGVKKEASIGKDDLKKISVRTLLRRANAYIKTHQYYNAKSDLEKAFEISPDESIKKELDNLKIRLSASS